MSEEPTGGYPELAFIAQTKENVIASCNISAFSDDSQDVAVALVAEGLDALAQNGLL